ncbi:hypothetical protein B0H16DRAFT_1889783 [Mycena metata]|uniref:Uncharacterized protein n=1 Tax=Mycena metata TaxID=1033252 RepID=A0AAD7IJQ7_9AGAR|nr:hypothetical protein B0H16DRAFT_1889783 [Mycena metata]
MVGNFYLARHNDKRRALEMAVKALALAEQAGDIAQQSLALNRAAFVQWHSGDFEQSQLNAGEALRRAKLGGDFFGAANALRVSAMCCINLGDFKRAVAYCAEGRELLRVCGLEGIDLDLFIISSEADAHFSKTEYAQAREIHVYLAEHHLPDKSAISHAHSQCTIAGIDVLMGAEETGIRERLNLAKSLVTAIPYRRGITLCDIYFAELDLREGRVHEAKRFYEQCFISSRTETDEESATYCLEKLADLGFDVHSLQTRLNWAVVALISGKKSGNAVTVHHALRCLGDIFSDEGNPSSALALLDLALEGFTSMDIHQRRAECMTRMGDIFQQQNELSKAADMWTTAIQLFTLSSQTSEIQMVREKLKLMGSNVEK